MMRVRGVALVAVVVVVVALALVQPAVRASSIENTIVAQGVVWDVGGQVNVNWTFYSWAPVGGVPLGNESVNNCAAANSCLMKLWATDTAGDIRDFAAITSFSTTTAGSRAAAYYNFSLPGGQIWRGAGMCVMWSQATSSIPSDSISTGSCYYLTGWDLYGQRLLDDYSAYAGATFEGRVHANATRLEMNATRTAQNDIQNATRTSQNDAQNATAAATYEGQVHANATWCPLTGVGCATSGDFSGNFSGTFSGVVYFSDLTGMISFDLSTPFYGDLSIAGVLVMLVWFAAFVWTATRHWYFLALLSWLGILQPMYVSGFGITFTAILSIWVLVLMFHVVLNWRDERKQPQRRADRS